MSSESEGDKTTKKLVGKELNDAIKNVMLNGNVSGLRELLETYDDVTERDMYHGLKALHLAGECGDVDTAKLLIQYGANVNAVDNRGVSVLYYASFYCNYGTFYPCKSVPLILELLCSGAKIDKKALQYDNSGLLVQIEERLEKLRNGERCITNLCSNEENKFKWNLAICLTLKAKVPAFRVYYKVCSFITYHGIFMASGYDLGKKSIWRKYVKQR
jgi:hypothetical protein